MARNTFQGLHSRVRYEAVFVAIFAVLCVTVGLVRASNAQQAKSAPAAGEAKKGAQIFQTRCIICHNKQPGDDSPFGPPNLFTAFKTKSISPPQAEQIITHGKGQMPSFANILSKSDVQSVIAYLRTGK